MRAWYVSTQWGGHRFNQPHASIGTKSLVAHKKRVQGLQTGVKIEGWVGGEDRHPRSSCWVTTMSARSKREVEKVRWSGRDDPDGSLTSHDVTLRVSHACSLTSSFLKLTETFRGYFPEEVMVRSTRGKLKTSHTQREQDGTRLEAAQPAGGETTKEATHKRVHG